jgi:SPP1 gp7 family putative phage head morphogenesis protein
MATKPPPPLHFLEAVRFFRSRIPMTHEQALQLDARERQRAFYVAGVTQLRLVGDIHRAITKAIQKGTTLEEFKREVTEKLENEWGGEKPGRLETIFRTNVQTAYSAGRLEQMDDPLSRKVRPYQSWNVIVDGRTTETICLPLANVVVPADSAFAQSRIPPLHFSCRTSISRVTRGQAEERGITSRPPANVKPQEGFGKDPRPVRAVDVSNEPAVLRRTFAHKLGGRPR